MFILIKQLLNQLQKSIILRSFLYKKTRNLHSTFIISSLENVLRLLRMNVWKITFSDTLLLSVEA